MRGFLTWCGALAIGFGGGWLVFATVILTIAAGLVLSVWLT